MGSRAVALAHGVCVWGGGGGGERSSSAFVHSSRIWYCHFFSFSFFIHLNSPHRIKYHLKYVCFI